MKTRYIFGFIAIAAILASCNTKEFFDAAQTTESGKLTFGTTVGDPLTKAHFDDATAPTKYIRWDATDKFDFHSITLGKDAEGKVSESVETVSASPSKISDDGKTAFFSQDAKDFMVITYPEGAVKIIDTLVNYKVDEYAYSTLRMVTATVPGTQPLSSALSPDLVPMTSGKLAISDDAAAADKEAALAFSTPVAMYPLAGIVKMTITGLPDVTSAKIRKVAIFSEFAGAAKDPSYGLSGEQTFLIAPGEDGAPALTTLSKYTGGASGNKGNADGLRIDLVSEEGIDYTAEKGVDVCFIVNNSSAGMKTVRVSVYATDGAVYEKRFTLDKNIGFAKSKVSVFELGFKDASVRKADTAYSVEWSTGYLVYDKENSGYKIGEPDQPGLYFKFGSALGVEFYPSTEDYAYRLAPADATVGQSAEINGVVRVWGQFTPDGQTQSNGSCYYFVNSQPSSGVTAAWRNRAYFAPDGGKIVSDTLRTHTEFQDKTNAAASKSFDGANDPCSYVKVGEGENKWRVPNADEVNDLISTGVTGLEFLNIDGTFPVGNFDSKIKQALYPDGQRTLVFTAFGSVPEAYSSGTDPDGNKYVVYKLQMLYSNKYAVRFWVNKLSGTNAQGYNLALGSAPSYTTKPLLSNYPAGATTTVTLSTTDKPVFTRGESLPVRCVRDKK